MGLDMDIKHMFEAEYRDDLIKYNATVRVGLDEACESYVLQVVFLDEADLEQAIKDGAFSIDEYPKDRPRAIVDLAVQSKKTDQSKEQ